MKRTKRHFSEEFKQEAIRQVQELGRPKSHIARDLDISEGLLYGWLKKYDEATAKGLTPAELSDEKAELTRIKRELKQVKEENAFLKKASAYFAKNQK